MNRLITIRMFWMLFSWLYWLPVELVWNSQSHKHINGNAHRSYQVLLFLCLWDNHSRCYWGSQWKATFIHKKLICSWSEQCSGVQHPPLANHDKSWCHLYI